MIEMNTFNELTDYAGNQCSIVESLQLYRNGHLNEVNEWLWNDLYHQGNIGTASIAWIIEAHPIFIQTKTIDWNYLGFCAAVMESIERRKFIPCPDWAQGRYRACLKRSLAHALKQEGDIPESERLTLIAATCAVAGAYDSFELVEYAWGGFEQKLMDLDFEQGI